MEQYTDMALIYDEMIDVDYKKWAEFIKEYFTRKGVTLKGGKALELACGTGNMTMELKGMGLDVVALDNSQDMLNIAAEKAKERYYKVMFVNHDMVNLRINKPFSFIFCFCDGYNYVCDENDLRNSFERVYRHLNKGGYFIFDISTAHKLKDVIGSSTFTRNEDKLCYIWDNYIEGDLIEMYISFFLKEGKLYRRFDEKHLQKAYSIDFILSCLRDAGFKNIELHDDYSFDELRNDSIRAAFIAQKEE